MTLTLDLRPTVPKVGHCPCWSCNLRVISDESFISNTGGSLADHGVLIIGTPSLQSQTYASAPSKEGHINCKGHQTLRDLTSRFFHNVFVFSMNDEVVHTGFYPMAHYLLTVSCGRKHGAGLGVSE